MMNDTKLIEELKLYINWFDNNMVIFQNEAGKHEEEMLMYVAAKKYIDRYSS